MTAPIYTVPNSAAVTLVAATPKTFVGVVGAAVGYGLALNGYRVSTNGITATNPPMKIDICKISTLGTATAVTPTQELGRVITAGVASLSAGQNHTVEPTGLVILDSFQISPNGSLVIYDFPLGTEFDCDETQGFCLRATDPTGATGIINGALKVSRI